MPGFGKLDWSNWLYGLLSGFIGGGAGAASSSITAALLAPDQFNITTSKFYILLGATFVVHGLLTMFAFLKQNALPQMTSTVTKVEQEPFKTTTTKTEVSIPVEVPKP